MSNYNPNINEDLLVKYLLGETSTEEKEAVEHWLQASESNRNYFGQFKTVWEESKKIATVSEVNEQAAWLRFKTRIQSPKDGQTIKETSPVRQMNRFRWMRVAALFVFIAGAALLIYTLTRKQAVETLTASSGNSIIRDTLSDGSVITLNKNSTLSYPEKFKEKTRTVALKGEAFFNVTPDKEKPFMIEVNDVVVKVVGTSFNIRSENGATEVIVETGIVQVMHKGQAVELRPGEKLIVPNKDTTLAVEKETDQLYNYYRSREFVCEDTPLWKLVEVLNKAYNANIIIERQELKPLRLNTTFPDQSLDHILEVIRLTFNTYNIEIIKESDRTILR